VALKQVKPERVRAGEVPHDALMRVDRRVKEIFARRDAALRARRAADAKTAAS